MSNFRLVYCVYGARKWIREAQFSILSALQWLEPVGMAANILVFTDQPEQFERYGVTIREVTASSLQEWRGANDFIYRIKIKALQQAMAELQCPTMLLDSDTYFKRSPIALLRQLKSGVSLMDRFDGYVFHSIGHAEFANYLSQAYPSFSVPLSGKRELTLDEKQSQMWVAGTVGIHPSDSSLLQEVLDFVDATTSKFKYFTIEQFAFSEILRQRTVLKATQSHVEHYWGDWVDPFYGVGKRQFITQQFEPILEVAENDGLPAALKLLKQKPMSPFRRPLWFRALNSLSRTIRHKEIIPPI